MWFCKSVSGRRNFPSLAKTTFDIKYFSSLCHMLRHVTHVAKM